MSQFQPDLRDLAIAAEKFTNSLDRWSLDHKKAAKEHGLDGVKTCELRLEFRQIVAAMRWGPSVGLYGESQAGKSALVSGFAEGLGVELTTSGALLLRDATTEAAGAAPPWKGDGGVDFEKWLDPNKAGEATGTVCRFVVSLPGDLQDRPGCYLVELMNLSELVSSLAIGYHAESLRRDGANHKDRVRAEVEKLWKLPDSAYEPDRERLMEQLLYAWQFLIKVDRFAQSPHFRELDDGLGAQGWDEFVIKCIRERRRPKFHQNHESVCEFDRCAELLWDSRESVSALWRVLSRRLVWRLQQASRVWVQVKDVCKDDPTKGKRPSLIDVDLVLSGSDDTGSCRVEFVDAASTQRPSLARSELAALARCVVLPMTRKSSESDPRTIDVIDFPGAHEGQNTLDFDDAEQSRKYAREALVRGRVQCLFAKTVELYDATALCLVQKGGDNNSAKKSIIASLQAWLEREGWRGVADPPADESGLTDPDGTQAAPPLVVAITRVDMFVERGVEAVVKQLKKLEGYSPSDMDWLRTWRGHGQPFNDVFWVHNRRKATQNGAKPLSDRPEVKEILNECKSDPTISDYSNEPDRQFEALLESPPTDIKRLFGRVKALALDDKRDVVRLARLADRLRKLVDRMVVMTDFYRGRGDDETKRRHREMASQHVEVLSRGIHKSHAFAEFLQTLSLTQDLVVRSYLQAARAVAEDDDDTHGTVGFDDFYEQLCTNFVGKIDKLAGVGLRWTRGIDEATLEELVREFNRLPRRKWFREPIREAASAFIDDYDSAHTRPEVLGSVVASVWNRNMVWLGELPATGATPSDPPRIRGVFEASKSILEHWESRLPDRYEELVDPEEKTAPHNARLGEHRKALFEAIDQFLAKQAVREESLPEWKTVVDGFSELRDRLREAEDVEPSTA